MFIDILFALSITLLVEPIIIYLSNLKDYKLFIISFLSNLILNPFMNIALIYLNHDHYYIYLAIFEFSTVILETLIIFFINKNNIRRTLIFVLLANLLSFAIGMMINNLKINHHTEMVIMIIFLSISILSLAFFLILLFFNIFHKKNNTDNNSGDNKGSNGNPDNDTKDIN